MGVAYKLRRSHKNCSSSILLIDFAPYSFAPHLHRTKTYQDTRSDVVHRGVSGDKESLTSETMIDTERIITAEVHPTHPIFREAIRILQAETINIERDSGDTGTVHESINILNRPGNRNFDVWDNFLPPLNNSTYQYEFRQATDIQVSSFVTSLQVNILLFLILLALYEIFSRLLPSVYQCRSSEGQDSVHLPKSYLPLNWVPSIFRVSWAQVRKNCGMDNYFFLRYVRMVLQISAVSGLWGLLILWYDPTLFLFAFTLYAVYSYFFPHNIQAYFCHRRQQRARMVLFINGKLAEWILEALVSDNLHVDTDILRL